MPPAGRGMGRVESEPGGWCAAPTTPAGKTRYLTPGELKAALEAAPEWLRAPMAFAACTGVRRGEMLSLRWMDVDMKNRRLYLRETKNGALRILPISESALTVLHSCRKARRAIPSLLEWTPHYLSVYTKRVFQAARHPGRQLSHSAPHGGILDGSAGRGPVRGGPDSRPQDTPHDATVRAPVSGLHGRCRGKAGRHHGRYVASAVKGGKISL